jgi:hypothetical protein
MEDHKEFENTLIVTEDMRSYFYDMAKWANFLAIVGFVVSGFMIISAFTVGAAMQTNPELGAMLGQIGALGTVGITIIFLLYGFAIFYPSWLMLKYATKAKQGILYNEQNNLNEALSKLKSLFKYWGILTIIIMALYAMMIVFTIMGQLPR